MREPARVSVVIPAFRAARYINEAVDSVLAQTVGPSEIVVVNDGSPDTPELEANLRRYGERVRYVRRENGGPGAARNTGILAATAPVVAFLDADDFWDPRFLEVQLKHLDAHPDVGLVYANATHFSDTRGVVTTLMDVAPSQGEATLEALLSRRCTVGTSAVVVRRRLVLDAGLFDEEIGNYSEDFDLFLRLLHHGTRFAYTREVLAHHRIHDASLVASPLQLQRGALRVLDKARRTMRLNDAESAALRATEAAIRGELHLESGKLLLLKRDYAQAAREFGAAGRYRRSWKLRVVTVLLRTVPGLLRLAVQGRLRARRGYA